MLKYSLIDNPLTERPDDYMAQTIVSRTFDEEGIVREMLRRGTLLTRTDALAVLNIWKETIVDIVLDGGTINTPLFNTSFSISGVFEGPMDSFDGSRHKLNVNVTKGTALRDAEKRVRVEKTDTLVPQPNIVEVKDAVSGRVSEKLTPGGVLQLWGNHLKIMGENPEVGLWFVPEAGGDAAKAEVVVVNKPSSIIAMIPATLAKGNYAVRIVTQFSGGGPLLKVPRMHLFDKLLEVE